MFQFLDAIYHPFMSQLLTENANFDISLRRRLIEPGFHLQVSIDQVDAEATRICAVRVLDC